MADPKQLHKGARVSWRSHSGWAHGIIQREITERTRVAGRTVAASKDDPRYVIRNDRSGRPNIHRAEVLRYDEG